MVHVIVIIINARMQDRSKYIIQGIGDKILLCNMIIQAG